MNCAVPFVFNNNAVGVQFIKSVELSMRYVKFVAAVNCSSGVPFVTEMPSVMGCVVPTKPVATFVTVMLDELSNESSRKLKV